MTCDGVYIVHHYYSPLQSTTANGAVPVSLSDKKEAAASSIIISSSKVHNDYNCTPQLSCAYRYCLDHTQPLQQCVSLLEQLVCMLQLLMYKRLLKHKQGVCVVYGQYCVCGVYVHMCLYACVVCVCVRVRACVHACVCVWWDFKCPHHMHYPGHGTGPPAGYQPSPWWICQHWLLAPEQCPATPVFHWVGMAAKRQLEILLCFCVCILNIVHALLTVCILHIYEHTEYTMNFMQSEKMESITVIILLDYIMFQYLIVLRLQM